jgi:hypothetical protein
VPATGSVGVLASLVRAGFGPGHLCSDGMMTAAAGVAFPCLMALIAADGLWLQSCSCAHGVRYTLAGLPFSSLTSSILRDRNFLPYRNNSLPTNAMVASDAAILPDVVRATTNATTIMIAGRIAGWREEATGAHIQIL